MPLQLQRLQPKQHQRYRRLWSTMMVLAASGAMNQRSLSRRRDRAAVAVVAQLSVVGIQLFPPLRGTTAGRGKESIRADRQGVTASTAGVR